MQRLKFSRRVRPAHRASGGGTVAHCGNSRSRPVSLLFRSLVLNPSPDSVLPLPDKPSIVVLPFVNMSDDPEQDYFSDGITEDLTTDLSKISSLFVIARNSAFTYKGKAVKVQDVSREMGVRYVLEGSVRKADNQVRITAQLIDATQASICGPSAMTDRLQDIFAVQDEIRQKIVTALKVQVNTRGARTVRAHPHEQPGSLRLLLARAGVLFRAVLDGKKEANEQARQMFEEATGVGSALCRGVRMAGADLLARLVLSMELNPQALERAFELAQGPSP